MLRSKLLSRLTPLLAVLLVVACDASTDATAPAVLPTAALEGHPLGLRVASWNAYLGGDIAPVFAASTPTELITAAATVWAQVQASGVPERARAIVDRLEEQEPAVIGLQEVFHFVETDGSFNPVAPPIDILGAIEAEITARGLPYSTAAVQEATSSALPVGIDPATGAPNRWVVFSDRIATLLRDDVTVTEIERDRYQAGFPLNPNLTLRRGWIRVEIEHRGAPVHIVNTHLEGQSLAPIQALQVDELLGSVLAGLNGASILIGDLNSDAAADPTAPSWTPTYDRLLADGFVDTWTRAAGARSEGFTCCQDSSLRNTVSMLDERIDFVLVRQDPGFDPGPRFEGVTRAERIGAEQADRTPSGLWPSDHAGLVADLVFAPGIH